MTAEEKKKLLKDPAFQRVLADALEIQNHFAAEAIYAKTGKGFLKSAGVSEAQASRDLCKNLDA